MKTSRLFLLSVVVVALVGLTSWWGGRPPSRDTSTVNDPVPAAGTADRLSSTWYCAAGAAGVDPLPTHIVFLSNPSDQAISVRLTAFGADGQVGSNVVEAPPLGVAPIDVNTLFSATGLSVMAESESGTLAVEHRLGTPTSSDSTACATTSSGAWFFPAQTTLRGTSAQITLFNPFSADAGVDITASVADGVRAPSQWAGIVVPAGTSRVIDLGQYVQTRDLFSVAVKMRTGRVVAETAQVLDIPASDDGTVQQRGIRLQVGVPEARDQWTFASGFTGPGVSERLVVYNPNRRSSSVVVQVTPYGAAEMPPEPFELEVPGNRFAVIDLSAESRIPAEGFHSIELESDDAVPVVVGRVISLTGPAGTPSAPAIGARPSETLGTTIGTGTPVDATRWLLPSVPVGPGQQPMVFVHNPGTGIVTVTVRALVGTAAPVVVANGVEVAPGDSAWIALNPAEVAALQSVADVAYEVVATDPVSVERTLTFVTENDVTVGLAVPVTP